MDELTIAIATSGLTRDLKEGRVDTGGLRLNHIEISPITAAMRRMVRGLEFDVCEMAITTYLCARAHGKRFTALPIFLVRAFHHGAILYNTNAGIRVPKDLEGRKVGVNRGYTVTTGLWARSVLQQEYGVDLGRITWVLSGDEHVAEYRPPANVVSIEPGKTLAQMLAEGELAAAIGVEVDHADVKPLIPDALEAGLAALCDRGHYPINHLIVVRDELLEAHADLAADVFGAFAESKRLYMERLKAGAIDAPTAVDRLHRRVLEITGDPLPYGIESNRAVLEELIDHALTQDIITTRVAPEELFPRSTRDLAA